MRILAPHKEQQGYVYLRMNRWGKMFLNRVKVGHVSGAATIQYTDNFPDQRIISSKRVEEAVETMDYLKKCCEEGLFVQMWRAARVKALWWTVGLGDPETKVSIGPTLREAYHRYHNAQ